MNELPEPITREEKYLAKAGGMETEIPEPITREEKYLAKACGMDVETPEPITRREQYLDGIAEGGGGGGFTPTDEQLTAMNSGIDSEKVQQIETNKNNISSIQQTIGDINTVLEGVL